MAYIPLINYRYDEGNRRIQTGPNHEGYVVLASGASAYGVDNGVIVAGTPLSGAVTSGTLSSGLWSKDANWRFVGRPLASGGSLDPRPYVPSGEILGTRNAFRILGRNKVAGAQAATAVGPKYPINPAPSQPRTSINPDTSSRYYAGRAPDNQNYTPFNTPEGNTVAQGKTGGGVTHRSNEGGILTNVLGSQGTSDRSQWRYNEPVYCQTFTEAIRSQSPSLMGNVLRYVYRGSSSTYNVNYGGYLTGGNAAGVSPGVSPAGAGGYYPAGAPYEPVPYVSGDTSPPPPAPTGVVFAEPLSYWYWFGGNWNTRPQNLPRVYSTTSGNIIASRQYDLDNFYGSSGIMPYGVSQIKNLVSTSGDRVYSNIIIPDPASGMSLFGQFSQTASLVDYSPTYDYVDLWMHRIPVFSGGSTNIKPFPYNLGRISVNKSDGTIKEYKNWTVYSKLNYNGTSTSNLRQDIFVDEAKYLAGTANDEIYWVNPFIMWANRASVPYGNPNSPPIIGFAKFDRDLNLVWCKCPIRTSSNPCISRSISDESAYLTNSDAYIIRVKDGVLSGRVSAGRFTERSPYFELDTDNGDVLFAWNKMSIGGVTAKFHRVAVDDNYVFVYANTDILSNKLKFLYRLNRDATQTVNASLDIGAVFGYSSSIFIQDMNVVDDKLLLILINSPTTIYYLVIVDIDTFTIDACWRLGGAFDGSQTGGTTLVNLPQKGWFAVTNNNEPIGRLNVYDMPSGTYGNSTLPSGVWSSQPHPFVSQPVQTGSGLSNICAGSGSPTFFVDYQSIPFSSGFIIIEEETTTTWSASGAGVRDVTGGPDGIDRLYQFANGYGL